VKGSAIPESVRNGGFLHVVGEIPFESLLDMSVSYSVLYTLSYYCGC